MGVVQYRDGLNLVEVSETNPLLVKDANSQANTSQTAENTSVIIDKMSNRTASGTVAANNQSVEIAIGDKSAAAIDISGTFSGTLTFQATINGTTWFTIGVLPVGAGTTSVIANSTTSTGTWEMAAGSYQKVRVIATSWTSGTATIALTATNGIRVVRLSNGVSIGGIIDDILSLSFNRTSGVTTAYAANQVIAEATGLAKTIANVARGNGTSGYLSLVLTCGNTSVTPRIRVHVYNAAPTAKNDYAAWAMNSSDVSKYLGYVDLDAMNGGVASTSQLKAYKTATASRDLWFEFQTLDAFTPASATLYTLRVIPDQNNV